MTASIHSFATALDARDQQDAVDQANIAAGWYFNEATKGAKAEFDATMATLRGTVGPRWNRERDAARAKFAADTKEANRLFDETVESFLSTGECSEELDNKWTALIEREALIVAMTQAAE